MENHPSLNGKQNSLLSVVNTDILSIVRRVSDEEKKSFITLAKVTTRQPTTMTMLFLSSKNRSTLMTGLNRFVSRIWRTLSRKGF